MSMSFKTIGEAWTFVLVARQRSWVVSDPSYTGLDFEVFVSYRGEDEPDAHNPEGQ